MNVIVAKVACTISIIIAFVLVRYSSGENLLEYWPRYGVLIAEGIAIVLGIYVIVKDTSILNRSLYVLIIALSLATTHSTIRQIGVIEHFEKTIIDMLPKRGIET